MGINGAITVLLLLFSYLHISAASTLNTTMDSAYSQKSVFDTNKTSTPLITAGFGGGGGGRGGGFSGGGRGGGSFRGGGRRGGGDYAGGHGFGPLGGGGNFHGHGGNKKSWSTKRNPCCSTGGILLMVAIGALLLE